LNFPIRLNVLCLNCCGLKKKTRYPEFENLVCKHDIICLQETKTDDFDQIDIHTIPKRPSPFVFKRSALTLNQNTNLHSVSTGEILSESCFLKPKAKMNI
jgi:hypothetical protein